MPVAKENILMLAAAMVSEDCEFKTNPALEVIAL